MRSLLITLSILAGIIAAAEGIGPRSEIYSGAVAGLVLGGVGFASSLLVWSKQRERLAAEQAGRKPSSRYDPLTWWFIGLLARGTLLTLICAGFWKFGGDRPETTLYALAAVYLVLHLWDTVWLYRKFTRQAEDRRHG